MIIFVEGITPVQLTRRLAWRLMLLDGLTVGEGSKQQSTKKDPTLVTFLELSTAELVRGDLCPATEVLGQQAVVVHLGLARRDSRAGASVHCGELQHGHWRSKPHIGAYSIHDFLC